MKKNFKKICKVLLLILVIIPCVFMFSACNFFNTKYVTKIEKTSSNGLVDTYTITYSDNSTSTFTITNGKDADLTITDIYNTWKEENSSTKTFNEFLDEYLSYNKTSTVSSAILSSVSVYSQHKVITEEPVYSNNGFFRIQTGTKEVKSTSVSAGSGIIYTLDKENGDAYLITNYHVVFNNDAVDKIGDIRVFLYGSYISVYKETNNNGDYILDDNGYQKVYYSDDAISCEYIGGSMNYDIAILKITNSDILKNSSAKAVTLADSYNVGDTAIAIGNPEAAGISVTQGIVSVESEYIQMTAADDATTVTFRTMRVDTAINSGNSGGGLFNEFGELIGIVNAKIVSSSIENIGYAIPRDIVVNVANNLIYNYEQNETNKVYKITIGLTLEITSSTAIYNTQTKTTNIQESVTIQEVSNNSIASANNFKAGDILKSVTINGTEYNITRMYNAIDLALTIKVGDTVSYKVERDGQLTTITFTTTSSSFSFID